MLESNTMWNRNCKLLSQFKKKLKITSLKMFFAFSRNVLSISSREVFVLFVCNSNIERLDVSFHSEKYICSVYSSSRRRRMELTPDIRKQRHNPLLVVITGWTQTKRQGRVLLMLPFTLHKYNQPLMLENILFIFGTHYWSSELFIPVGRHPQNPVEHWS